MIFFLVALAAGADPAQAAMSAQSAASVANAVALSAQDLADEARNSLKRAHSAIEAVRKETSGLSDTQKKHLTKAQRALDSAAKKVEFEELEEAEWMSGVAAGNGASAESLDALQAEVDGMADELGGLTDQQRQELEKLRVEVEAQRDGVETSGTLGALKDRLDGIERQIDIADDVRKLSSKLEGEDSLGDGTGGGAANRAAGQSAESAALRNRLDGLQDRYENLKRDVETDDVSVDEIDTLNSDARRLQNDVADEVLKSENNMADDAEDTGAEEGFQADSVSETDSTSSSSATTTSNADPPPNAAPAAAAEGEKSSPPSEPSTGGPETDVDMPYGELAPFGREDTAQELTDDAIRESDAMVDQLERAQVAETKRAVFRSLTRLRGAAINSFDGIARAQTGNIDEYAHTHKWRDSHPVHHLAAEEADVSKWAFPANADFFAIHSWLHKRMPEPETGREPVKTLLAQW
jgi:hypothetical protein